MTYQHRERMKHKTPSINYIEHMLNNKWDSYSDV